MDEIIRTVARGLPGVILVIAMAATGLTGAAAITAALAFLGGPAGMLGGIAVLGVVGLISQGLAQYGIDALLIGIYQERLKTEPKEKLCKEIDQLPISWEQKLKLKAILGCP
ncbi:hypothetical protein ACE1CD_20575 [Aerosakkonema sp. BLCC-F183]|uniref:hypothetical protein n=1 Tax=Aerosakkonema sp. BLCC-F183 TaxID=3342834 RepID=UPI0035B81EBA